ncbi:MAG: iron-sulfur cluster repair di-iron protein, ric [Acidaminobacteraceae bacterium]
MSKQLGFDQVMETHFKKLELYVPVVSRVHGESHPEFYEVHKLYDAIKFKIKEVGSNKADLSKEFSDLRKVTNDYTIPSDVCESYEAVYNMLGEIDKAYHI